MGPRRRRPGLSDTMRGIGTSRLKPVQASAVPLAQGQIRNATCPSPRAGAAAAHRARLPAHGAGLAEKSCKLNALPRIKRES